MIRYRHLYESENSDIKLYDVVRCAGYKWYVIDIDGDIVTLLGKGNNFGHVIFDEESNDYKTSEIREYLNNHWALKLQSANPIPTYLPDVGVTDKVWLLSVEEANKLPAFDIRMNFTNDWWLRTPNPNPDRSNQVADVDCNDGGVYESGSYVNDIRHAVRPAMRVRIEDLD